MATTTASSAPLAAALAASATQRRVLSVGTDAQRVVVHPLALFSILDHYVRRNKTDARVIGTLLGSDGDGIVEIHTAYPVPHSDAAASVEFDVDYHKNMLELHQKAAPKSFRVVGWYSTGTVVGDNDVLIHELYEGELTAGSSPVHLLVDAALASGSLQLAAVASAPFALPGAERPLGARFVPLPLDVDLQQPERAALDAMLLGRKQAGDNQMVTLLSDVSSLHDNTERLLAMLDRVAAYVDQVVAGTTPADAKLGRFLLDAVASLPKMDAATFDKVFNNSLQDVLLVVYLANLTRTQLALAAKLAGTS